MSDTVLSLRGATKRFGGLVAVDAIDFDVRAGQVLGLIGPNGSGKSSAIRWHNRRLLRRAHTA